MERSHHFPTRPKRRLLWWAAFTVACVSAVANWQAIEMAVFVTSEHESPLSLLVLSAMVVSYPLAVLAFPFPRLGAPLLVGVNMAAMVALGWLVEFDVSEILFGWLRFFLPFVFTGIAVFFSTRPVRTNASTCNPSSNPVARGTGNAGV